MREDTYKDVKKLREYVRLVGAGTPIERLVLNLAEELEKSERERGWLIELAAGITDVAHTGSTKRVDEAWIAMSTEVHLEIQAKETKHNGDGDDPEPLPYTAGRLGPKWI